MYQVTLLGSKISESVIYLEASKDFVDFLITLLQLPTGTSMKLLSENNIPVGTDLGFPGISSLYSSVKILRDSVLLTPKDAFLNPESIASDKLLCLETNKILAPTLAGVTTVYRCNCAQQFSFSSGIHVCTSCRAYFNMAMTIRSGETFPTPNSATQRSGITGFVKENVTFIVSDNLEMFPSSTIKSIEILNRLNVSNMRDLVSVDVVVDKDKAIQIVKSSLISKTVLNDVFGPLFKLSLKERSGSKKTNVRTV